MSNQKKDTRFNNIIKNLSSKNKKEVLTAIKQLRKHGKPEAINHLINLYKSSNNLEIKASLSSFFFDLKDQSATQPIIDAISNENEHENKAFLISIFWQSALDGSEHINFFVQEAIKGDYLIAIETLTVIDNFDSTFQESEIVEIQYDLDEAIENQLDEKKDLLITLKTAINSLNMEF